MASLYKEVNFKRGMVIRREKRRMKRDKRNNDDDGSQGIMRMTTYKLEQNSVWFQKW